nr:MAG TPA: hypothetical protein [Caudoviricetes sp.]
MKGCKNCPAYAKCTVTYRGSACAALRSTYGLDNDPEFTTNADRIRAMSDEELGKFLYGYFWGRLPVLPNREEKLLDWLQQPAEEGD